MNILGFLYGLRDPKMKSCLWQPEALDTALSSKAWHDKLLYLIGAGRGRRLPGGDIASASGVGRLLKSQWCFCYNPSDWVDSPPDLGFLLKNLLINRGQFCYQHKLVLWKKPQDREIRGGHRPLTLTGYSQELEQTGSASSHTQATKQSCIQAAGRRADVQHPIGKIPSVWLLCDLINFRGRKKKHKHAHTLRHKSFLKWSFCFCGFVTTAACFIFRFSEKLVSRFLEVAG